MALKANGQALRVALIYVSVAGCWILFSDEVLKWLVHDPEVLVKISIFKGWAFVLLTGGLLYLVVRRLLGSWEQEARQRGQAEAQSEASEKHLRLILEASNDGLWDWNILTGEDTFSRRWKEIVGYQEHELKDLKSTFFGLVHPDDLDRVKRATSAHLERRERYAVEFRMRHKDGDYRWVLSRGEALRDASGRAIRMVGATTDITDRKLVEEKMRESEEKFSKTFQSSPMPVTISVVDTGRYVDVNNEFLKMVQRTRDEVVGHTALDIGVWADPSQRTVVIEKVNAAGSIRNVELSIRTPLGQIRQILWSAEVVYIGGERCLLGTSLDITELKLAEQNHRESENRYRQLFELESDAIILLDCETRRFVDVNRSAEQLYGYTREEFLQMTVDEVSDEPEKPQKSVDTAASHFIPLRWHRKKNGQRFALEITFNVISYQGRRTELATLRDITARQQVMSMLGETTDQLLEAQRIAGLGSYTYDIATGRWSGSQVLDEIFGLDDAALARDEKTWTEIIHPEDRRETQRYLHEVVLKDRKPFDRIYRITRLNDRETRWVHRLGKLVLNEHGQLARIVGVIQDITERKRAEERMNVQVSALTAADNAIVITNQSGGIEWVNPAFSKLTGYAAEEAVGNSLRLLKSDQHPPAFYANLWSTVLTGNVWHGEIVNRRKDGHTYTEEMTVTPVRGTDGQIAHFVAIKQDVTEQRDLERRMQQSQKMEAIGTLAGGIAHDFNNILAAMFGYVYLLQQDLEGNPAAQENIEEILKAASRAKDLVQQILTFSRQREQKPQVIQLDTVVREAIKFLRASVPSQIKIEMDLSAAAPLVLADPTQIYQVTVNLAANAVHAMEGQTGQLTVNLDHFQPDGKFIQSHPEFRPVPYARLTVADTGHGMDAKTLVRIFEPFFTTKPVGKGTGLGLAVVHGIVQSHHGVISVDSQVGRGTTFRLYFPGRTRGVSSTVTPEHQPSQGRGQKILLVDDEPALTSALQQLLVRMNYHVTASNSAREAIGWCQKDSAQFDLVITDLSMPEINGMEVARQLRALRPDLPIVMASGFSADLSRENLQAAGISELLEKPISKTALANALQRTLSGRDGCVAVE